MKAPDPRSLCVLVLQLKLTNHREHIHAPGPRATAAMHASVHKSGKYATPCVIAPQFPEPQLYSASSCLGPEATFFQHHCSRYQLSYIELGLTWPWKHYKHVHAYAPDLSSLAPYTQPHNYQHGSKMTMHWVSIFHPSRIQYFSTHCQLLKTWALWLFHWYHSEDTSATTISWELMWLRCRRDVFWHKSPVRRNTVYKYNMVGTVNETVVYTWRL